MVRPGTGCCRPTSKRRWKTEIVVSSLENALRGAKKDYAREAPSRGECALAPEAPADAPTRVTSNNGGRVCAAICADEHAVGLHGYQWTVVQPVVNRRVVGSNPTFGSNPTGRTLRVRPAFPPADCFHGLPLILMARDGSFVAWTV
jgi:hypothetical protein